MEANEMRLQAQDLNNQGELLLKSGHVKEAREKFDKAIEADPMLADSYKNYGDLYMHLEQYQDAKNSFKKAMLIEKNGYYNFLYGSACFLNDEPNEGLEQYNIAISEGYDNDEMLFFMGMAYEHTGDSNMALRYFQRACVKNPSNPEYIVKKIEALMRLEMVDEAIKAADELLLSSPELYDAYHLKTQLFMYIGKKEEAVEFAKSAADKFPEDADLLFDYANALVNCDRTDEAMDVCTQAEKMKYFEEAKRNFMLLEGRIYAIKNDAENAVKCCRECIELEGEDGFDNEARFMLMNLYLALPDYEKALEQAAAMVKRDAEDSFYYAALYYRPYCLAQLGKNEEAAKLYKEANSIYRLASLNEPGAVDIYLYRAMCLKELEEYSKALELLDFISNLNDQIAEIYVIRAEIYRLQGRKALQEAELEKAYALKPELKPEEEEA